MNTLFVFMVKAALYLVAFYLVYSIMLSRDTAYIRNRSFILISIATALILPLFTFKTLKPHDIQFFGKLLSEVFITDTPVSAAEAVSGSRSVNILQLVYTIYILGVIIYIARFIIDILNLIFLIVRQKNKGSRIIRFNGFNTAGFSALGYVFINSRLNPEEAGEVIKHEQNHLRNYHFVDIIFIEIIKACQWFNPAVYLFNRALRALHEFQADQECLSSGVPIVHYQSLLLSQIFRTGSVKLTNSFSNPSLIKRRMIMMTKERTTSVANLKLLFVIPVTAVVFFAISAYSEIPDSPSQQTVPAVAVQQPSSPSSDLSVSEKPSVSSVKPDKPITKPTKSNAIRSESTSPPPPPPPPILEPAEPVKEEPVEDDGTEPFVVVEEMPVFPGGDAELVKYILENTRYPEFAKANLNQGRVIVRFCITAKGGISMASVLKGVSPELDAEAIRVVNALPAFSPGKQGGKAVPVWFSVPITFTLK